MGYRGHIQEPDSSQGAFLSAFCYQSTKTFHDEEKERQGERKSLLEASFCMKETKSRSIDENTIGDRSQTTHDPIDESKGEADVSESHPEMGPTGTIKGFGEIIF